MPDDISSKPASDEDPWLTVQHVATELKLHPATVRIWIKNGRLRAVRAGREWRVRRSDVEHALMADASPGYADRQAASSSSDAERGSAPTQAPRQIADHIMSVGSAKESS